MLINQASLDALRVGLSSIFQGAFAGTPMWGDRLATTVPSTAKSNVYGWMAKLPAMREWLGPRVVQNASEFAYTLTNKTWELTVGVDREDIEDDNIGVYNPLVADMGRAGAKNKDQQLKTALQAGTTGLGFDGLAMFSTAHTLDPAGTQSNNFTSTALSAANYETVRAAMLSYTGEDGEPLGVNPNLLIVPPALEDEAKEILVAERNAAGATNIHRGEAGYLMIPELANQPTTWYLADVTRPIKPLLFQVRRAIQMVTLFNMADPNVFFQKQYVFGIDGRSVAGYGPWPLIARAIQ